jgi:5'-deoxynucleotidase YfbR-like HD superfamily hydrolase
MEIYKLKTLVRYNHRLRLTNESVAEHSFFTALFVLEVCDKLNIKGELKAKSIEYALLHDVPEVVISDVPSDVKDLSDTLRMLLKIFEDSFMENSYPDYALYSKDEQIFAIVKLADLYSVRQYCMVEAALGNKTFDFADGVNRRIDEMENNLIKMFTSQPDGL